MPLFDRLNSPPPPDDDDPSPRVSPLIPGRSGRPSISLEALRERVEEQFREETAHRADIFAELDTEEARRRLLREVADYVFAVEAVTPTPAERATILDKAYRHLFTFGPLDSLLSDDNITEISIDGPYDIHARAGLGAMTPTDLRFDDTVHLEDLLTRLLAPLGASPSPASPFIEIGLVMNGRPARISIVVPPISPVIQMEIRLHPAQAVRLDDLQDRYATLHPDARALLEAIVAAGHGLLIVGEASAGKTTLAGALVDRLASAHRVIAVERAGELHLPPQVTRYVASPPTPDGSGSTFADQINRALGEDPAWLVIDEIRGDEAVALWAALEREETPHALWVFRGSNRPDRLRSALNMIIRRAHPALDQAAIDAALLRHLPFVVGLERDEDRIRLRLIGEWVQEEGTLTLAPLMGWTDRGWSRTGHAPRHTLNLPDSFWDS